MLCLALDVPNIKSALTLVDKTKEHVDLYKVGLQLFISEGTQVVKEVLSRKPVFLDLKLNDIPQTVSNAIDSLGELGVSYTTIHASGGPKMIEDAVNKADKFGITVLVVTVLTSLNDDDLLQMNMSPFSGHQVITFAKMAKNSGAKGFVCSPQEVSSLRKEFGSDVTLVTPGIRFANVDDDQKRVATPEQAIQNGADILVVGRPIRDSQNPNIAAKQFKDILTSATQ